MSKYSTQDILDEKGQAIFQKTCDNRLFDVSFFGYHDKTPDIDGRIRLRDEKGENLNRHLDFQLKSPKKIKNNKIYCKHKIIKYFLTTNVPTILIIVEVSTEKVFWHYIEPKNKNFLRLCEEGKGTTLDLTKGEFGQNNQKPIHSEWLSISSNNYEKSKTILHEIAFEFATDLTNLMGLLFLLQKVEIKKSTDILSSILKLDLDNIQTFTKRLLEKQLIISTEHFYLVENERIGRESLKSLIDEIELDDIFKVIKTEEDISLIYKQLVDVDHKKVRAFFKNTAIETYSLLKKHSDNTATLKNLELLKYYAFREPGIALDVITHLICKKKVEKDKTLQNYALIHSLYEDNSNRGMFFKCIEILKDIRYIKTKDVLRILFNLYNSSDETVMKFSFDAIKAIVSYDLHALKVIQYKPQLIILDEIEKFSKSQKKLFFVLLCEICSEILESSFEGHGMKDYRTVVFSRGALLPTNKLKDLRNRSISYLYKMFSIANTIEQKKLVLSSLSTATETPHSSKCGKKLEDMIKNSTENIIDFYISILDSSENEIVRIIENKTSWFSHRFKKLRNLEKIRAIINNKDGYQIYSTFIGFDTDRRFGEDWQKARDEREAQISKIIQEVNDGNLDSWREKFLSIIVCCPNLKPGESNYFRYFLRKLGKEKPTVALKFLKQSQQEMHSFATDLIVGIWDSGLNHEAKRIISKWSMYKSKINICADVFGFNDVFDFSLVEKILIKAIDVKNYIVVKKLIGSIVRNYENNLHFKHLVLWGISKLTSVNDSGWIDDVWYVDKKKSFLDSLNNKGISIILRNLLVSPRIDYNHELVLKYIANKYPAKLIKFFENRIKYGIDRKDKSVSYDAVPYELHELSKPLQENCEIVFNEILSWFRKKHWSFKWEAGHLIEKIFPDLTPQFEKIFIRYIKSKDPNVPKVVFKVLEAYEGQSFLHKICQEFIKTHGSLKDYKMRMFLYLSKTGVVCGEDGFVRAYEEKQTQIQSWKTDKNKKVCEFAIKYEKYLANEIQREKQKANEDINLFKRGIR